jgi:hypothetical protein
MHTFSSRKFMFLFYFIIIINHIVDDSMIKLETKGFTFLVVLSSSFVVANIMVTGSLYGR